MITTLDIAYGADVKQRFDLYTPDNGGPFGVAIFFHGGGFIGGSKSEVSTNWRDTLIAAGLAVISADYRLNANNGSETEGAKKAFTDAVYLVKFIKFHSATYNIDPAKIGVYGKSAGAGLALFLCFTEDRFKYYWLDDPIQQLSSRIACAVAQRPQSTYWTSFWDKIYKGNAGFDSLKSTASWQDTVKAFYGVPTFADSNSSESVHYGKQLHLPRYIRSTNPEWYLFNEDNEDTPDDLTVAFHDPRHAKFLHEKAVREGSPVNSYLQTYGIADTKNESIEEFLIRKLA